MAAGFTIAILANLWRKNWGYVVVLILAIAETYSRYRFELHTWARIEMIGAYPRIGDKEILQSKLIYVGGMLFFAVVVLLLPYFVRANAGRRLMVAGSLIAVTVFNLELISPHHIDRILYHTVVLFALAAVVYFFSALLIAAGAILDRRR